MAQLATYKFVKFLTHKRQLLALLAKSCRLCVKNINKSAKQS